MPAPIVYFELAGPDPGALRRFYASVFDWRSAPDGSIDAASTGGIRGGFRQDPAEKVLYLGVPSIETALQAVVASGGAVVVPRTAVPGVVTFAVFRDPAGNLVGLA